MLPVGDGMEKVVNQVTKIFDIFNHPDLYSSNNNLMMWGVGAPNVTDIQFNYFLNPGDWCDALITHDGVELKIYVDGSHCQAQEYSSDVFSSPLILGKKRLEIILIVNGLMVVLVRL